MLCVIAPFNVLLNYLLVWSPTFGLGFIGAPIATTVSVDLMAAMFLVYCYFFVPKIGWCGFRREALSGWGPVCKLGISGYALDSSEW